MLRTFLLYSFIILVVIAVPLNLFSQEPDDLPIVHLSNDLSGSTITAIYQDYQGFLWFGTRSGLYKYNGVEFVSYECDNDKPGSLSSCYIEQIFEDKDQQLWIGTFDGGLNKYVREKNAFLHYRHDPENPNSISSNIVWEIYQDSKNRLWVGTSSGMDLFDPVEEHFKLFDVDHPLGKGHSLLVNFIMEDDLGQLWMGTRRHGLFRLKEEGNTFIPLKSNDQLENLLTNPTVRCGFKNKDGDIWIGTDKGLNRLFYKEGSGYQIEQYPQFNHVILSVCEDDKGRVWIGSENAGLYQMDPKTGEVIHFYSQKNQPGLSSNSIWSIFEDKVGTVWFGTFNQGINKLDQYHNKFKYFLQLPDKNVNCFFEDKKGGIWIGTDGGGLYFWDRQANTFKGYRHDQEDPNSMSSDAVVCILEDSNDKLWIGTWDGLNILNRETGRFKRFLHDKNDPSSIFGNRISSLIEDQDGMIWVGVNYVGISIYNPQTGVFYNYGGNSSEENALYDNLILKLYEDKSGQIWVGTEGGGLYRVKLKNGQRGIDHFLNDPNKKGSLSNDIVFSLMEDREGALWVGTSGGGLNLFNPEEETFFSYRKKDGLPDNVILGMLEDDTDKLWISTSRSISYFDKKENTFKNYDLSDIGGELQFLRNSCLKTSDGAFLFGGTSGFISFKPKNIMENPNIPQVYITGFSLDNEVVEPGEEGPLRTHISEAKSLRLAYHQNDFSFEFSALNYSQAAKNQYEYILENYDEKWQKVGIRRNAYYTKVPPGEYIFKVKGSNNDGKWNDNYASIVVKIAKPWYKSHLAWIVYALLLISAWFWYRNNLLLRERLRSDLKMEQMELTKMQELSQMRSQFFANISHEFRTPLTLILDPLKNIAEGRYKGDIKNQLRMIIRNGERLLRLVNQLLDLSKLGSGRMKLETHKTDLVAFLKPVLGGFDSFAEQLDINYSYSFEEEKVELFIDEDKMEKIVLNLLTNAFKFTQSGGSIDFSVKKQGCAESPKGENEQGWVRVEVKDTGIGIEEKSLPYIFDRFFQVEGAQHKEYKGTGIGLSLVKELVEIQKGKIEVQSEVEEGTTFTIYLRSGRAHLSDDQILSSPKDRLKNHSVEGEIASRRKLEKRVPEPLVMKEEGKPSSDYFEELPLILIVEDNEDVRAYISEYLGNNYRILEAANGKEGWNTAREQIPDLIITDIRMPEMDGIELCKKLKKEFKTNHIPLVMLSAKTGAENKTEGFESGADHYVTKPFNSRLLELQIRNILSSHSKLKEQLKVEQFMQKGPGTSKAKPVKDVFMNKVLEIMEENLDNSEFNIEEFCRAIFMSRMQLYRKLKAVTGMSPNNFVRKYRLQRAAELLKQSQFAISEITYKVGFSDLKYFRDCFKKEFGQTPSKYRQKPGG